MFGHEVDPNIFKVLQLNSYIYGFKLNNFQLCDSMTNKSQYKKNEYDVLTYNPPFGASFDVTDKEMFPIKVKNSVALFLQLGFKSLKENGRCGVVVDQGIINNGTGKTISWESKIRKELLENGLKKIILLPTGAFQYTTFAICVLIYDKTYKDKKIIYEEGYFKDEDKGTRIKQIHFKNIGEISYEQVEQNKYSLKYNDYFKVQENNEQDTTGWIKLGDVCELLTKSKHKAVDSIDEGQYNFYTSSSIIKKSNFNDYKNISIIIGSGGNGSLFIDKNFSCSADNFILNCTINIKYVYYYLKINFKKLYELYKGNGLKHLSQSELKAFLIPNLPLSHQEEIVKFLDEYFSKHSIDEFNEYLGNFNVFKLLIDKNYGLFDKLQSYILMIKESEKLIEDQSDWKHENKKKYLKQIKQGYDIITVYKNNQSIEDMNFIFNNMIKTIITLENVTKMRNLQIQSIFQSYRPQCEIKKLGDICNLNRGKTLILSQIQEGKYPVIGGGQKPMGFHNEYNRQDNTILVSQSGSYAGYLSKYSEKVWASDCFSIIPKDNLINKEYLWNYLKSYQKNIYKLQHGNGQPHVNTNDMINFNIPVPPLEVQEEIIKRIEALEQKSSHYNQYTQMLQTELDNISDIINNMTTACTDNQDINNDNQDINNDNQDINEDEIIETSEDKPVKKQKKKKELIEHKGKTYILEDNKVFKMDENNKKGTQYGAYLDGKIKKLKTEETEITI